MARGSFSGLGCQHAHKRRVKEIPAGDIVLNDPPLNRKIHQHTKDFLQGQLQGGLRLLILLELQHLQQAVDGPDAVLRLQQPLTDAIVCQSGNI